ncbi:hypothetical protein [Calycomorphotria hydatis]|uniref:Uncharacterized protein n=1 Tax=Calycomorphotria hydatis TaxID=2528027 RepID=A0A517T7N1_9PLAN|nr:hypothetical protein [Calycomorphotria hydatis]QDT64383.1 hypothetical protein V22_16170 [Calycomorphotria hydatis]
MIPSVNRPKLPVKKLLVNLAQAFFIAAMTCGMIGYDLVKSSNITNKEELTFALQTELKTWRHFRFSAMYEKPVCFIVVEGNIQPTEVHDSSDSGFDRMIQTSSTVEAKRPS